MNFRKRFQLHRIVNAAESRYSIAGIRLHETFATATDGRCAAIVPIDVAPGDVVDRIAPRAAWESASKAARSPGRKAEPVARIDAEPKPMSPFRVIGKDGSVASYDAVDGRFPDVLDVFPSGAEVVRIGLNAELLASLAMALGAEGHGEDEIHGVELIVYASTLSRPKDGVTPCVEGPIEVRPLHKGIGSRGCIMPIAIDPKG